MKQVEKLYENHHIHVYKDGQATRIQLLDNSGDGGFLDTSRPIKEEFYPGGYLIPLEGGSCTPGTAAEVAKIVRRLPVVVERVDYDRDTDDDKFATYAIHPSLFPADDKALENLLSATYEDSVGCSWFPIMEQAMNAGGTANLF